MAEAKIEIAKTIRRGGPFSHNIVGCVLRMVAKDFGYAQANALVDEFKLTKRYGIPKVNEQGLDKRR